MKKKYQLTDEQKKERREMGKALDSKLDTFLAGAMQSKASIDDLTAHYRISKLYNYSFYNSILIKMQGGTICQSFQGWKRLKRFVQKGTHSNIFVCRPMFKKVKNTTTGEEESKLLGFAWARVFDISLTDGEALQYDHNSLDTYKGDYEAVKSAIENLCGVSVVEGYTGTARGFADGKQLAVSVMSNTTDRLKTLFHEAGHHIMHHKDDEKTDIDRATKEVEAESVAYLVLSFMGLDYDLSEAYVANWAQAGGTKYRTKKILKCAEQIIKAMKGSEEENELVEENDENLQTSGSDGDALMES